MTSALCLGWTAAQSQQPSTETRSNTCTLTLHSSWFAEIHIVKHQLHAQWGRQLTPGLKYLTDKERRKQEVAVSLAKENSIDEAEVMVLAQPGAN